MTAAELLVFLDSNGVELVAADGRLRVNAARGQLTDDLKAAIGAHKTELLELLAQRSAAPLGGSGQAVARVERDGSVPLPLSFFQERLWVMNKFDPESTAYNLVGSWSSTGPVDVDMLRAALRAMIERHETLRSRFEEHAGTASVVVMPADSVSIDVRELGALTDDEQRAEINAAIAAAAHTPFDLAAAVPVRVMIFRGAGDRVTTLVAAHHIVVDAWSMALIGQEIGAAYGYATHGSGAPSRDEARGGGELQYVDFAAWERTTQDPRAIAPELAWWKQHLAGAPPVSTLPPDRPRGAAPAGDLRVLRFSREVSTGLRALVREEGATEYMACVAACAAVLHWYTGQDDVILGSPMGLRERPEFERIVGPFVNVLVLRLGLADDPTLAELLHRARGAVLDAHAHRNVSFERLVEHINPARSIDHGPLFQVAVVMHTAADPGNSAISGGGALFDITWFVREVDGQLVSGLEYRSDLYDAETIDGVASRLEAVLTAMLHDRRQHLSELSLITPRERAQILDTFNATQREVDLTPFSAQFSRQAAATPSARAVSFDGASWTYAELDGRSNQIARQLTALGVGRGVLVAISMARSLDMVAALVAIQKAGGAYVPLDPDFPVDRLNFMLADSGARVLVVDGGTPDDLEVPPAVAVLDLAAAAATIAAQPADAPATGPEPADLAYVIYTSGSTGRPKGVCIPHRALSNFLGAMRREPGIAPADVLAAVTTLSFDIAALELYLPLVAGASVVVVPREIATDGERLARLLDANAVTMLQATPATWRLLLESGWAGQPALKALTGGEALPPELAEPLTERVGELWNMYGPTETTVWSTVARIRAGDPVTIGKPIANTRVYVLDSARRLMPASVAGELWIGGDGVALGYHARPELTAERFMPDRFAPSESGARMYRTGDRARWRPDGTLEHLGRLDYQVKIRGYRIEPGEIEAVLESNAAISHAVVMPRGERSGDARLVAYIVFASGEDLSVSEVRRFLRARLPDYMVPSMFVTLEAMPLTPNGKVDRNALPDPFTRVAETARAERTPPSPGMESVLADIWRSVLRVSTIGAEDNFFDLGGHSLLALRVAAAIEERTGWRMDPRLLFFQQLRQIAAAAPNAPAFEPLRAT